VRTSAFEPWSPAGGFLLPADGVWRRVSRPLGIALPALRIVARTSDGLVPSWGGELFLRLDATALRDAGGRRPVALGLVVADRTGVGTPLAYPVLEALGSDDLVAIVDADGRKVVLPAVPCTHRTLASGALARRLVRPRGESPRDLGWALSETARLLAGHPPARARILVITDEDPTSPALGPVLARLRAAGVSVTAVAAHPGVVRSARGAFGTRLVTGSEESRVRAILAAVPPPGKPAIDQVTFSLSAAPAPVRIVEASGGEIESDLVADTLRWSAMRSGEARTEVIRVSLPVWTPGEPLELELTASYRDLRTGRIHSRQGRFVLGFSDDVLVLGEERYGDVLAYASALAMVHRLGRAFLGSRADSVDGFRGLVEWQARSMFQLARRFHDPAMRSQGLMLEALLSALYG
jgi:hypothetical protein